MNEADKPGREFNTRFVCVATSVTSLIAVLTFIA